jgi:hypothetical protein
MGGVWSSQWHYKLRGMLCRSRSVSRHRKVFMQNTRNSTQRYADDQSPKATTRSLHLLLAAVHRQDCVLVVLEMDDDATP